MILSGKEIQRQLGKQIHIDPFDSANLNPNSYNLRLHHELAVYDSDELDMKLDNPFHKITIPEDGYLLSPGKLYLGRTVEKTCTQGFVPMLEGRSSIGRLGLFVHISAGFGDVGFNGYWTLEIHCVQPVRIYPNVSVCQIYYHTISGEYDTYQGGKYQDNQGIQSSQLYRDFK